MHVFMCEQFDNITAVLAKVFTFLVMRNSAALCYVSRHVSREGYTQIVYMHQLSHNSS